MFNSISLFYINGKTIRRQIKKADLSANQANYGRNLFSIVRANISTAEEGATIFDIIGKERS